MKEAIVVIDARYHAYYTKVQHLLDINWTREDEYRNWLEKYDE